MVICVNYVLHLLIPCYSTRLYRWKDVTLFLSGFQNEGVVNAMHVLLVYLQSSSPEQQPMVAVLLLHLDLLVCSLNKI